MKRRSFAFDDVPIICLDDDEDNDNEDLKIEDENTMKGKSKVLTLADIQRDNRAAERRKRRIVGFEAKRTERTVPLHKSKTKQDNRALKFIESKTKTLSKAAPLIRIQEDIQRDNIDSSRRKPRIAESEVRRTSRYVLIPKTQRQGNKIGNDTLSRAIPLVRIEDYVQKANVDSKRRKRRFVEFEARKTSKYDLLPKPQRQGNRAGNDTLRRAIPLVRVQEDVQRNNTTDSERRKNKADELKTETLSKAILSTKKNKKKSKAISLVRTEQVIQRDNRAIERRKRRMVDFEGTRTTRSVPLHKTQQRENKTGKVLELKSETLTAVPLVRTQEDNQQENKNSERTKTKAAVTYRLARQVNRAVATKLKDVVKVKVETDLDSGFDGSNSDIIAISNSPFFDGEDTTPFVTSKKVINLDEGCKDVERSSSWFKKELMNILSKPYNEEELKELHNEASIHRRMTRSRELRSGRETDYKTDKLGQSYLERFTDFENEYKAVDGFDKVRALELLRGFFFYLKNVSHDGAVKPWIQNHN